MMNLWIFYFYLFFFFWGGVGASRTGLFLGVISNDSRAFLRSGYRIGINFWTLLPFNYFGGNA